MDVVGCTCGCQLVVVEASRVESSRRGSTLYSLLLARVFAGYFLAYSLLALVLSFVLVVFARLIFYFSRITVSVFFPTFSQSHQCSIPGIYTYSNIRRHGSVSNAPSATWHQAC